MAGGDIAGSGCDIVVGGDASTNFDGGGHSDGWDFPLDESCCGRGTNTANRAVDGMGHGDGCGVRAGAQVLCLPEVVVDP